MAIALTFLQASSERINSTHILKEKRIWNKQLREAVKIYDLLFQWTANPIVQEIAQKFDLHKPNQVAATPHLDPHTSSMTYPQL